MPVRTAQHKDSIREATSESEGKILATVHAAEIHESGKRKKMRLKVANYNFVRFESHDVTLHTADWHQISAPTQLPALRLRAFPGLALRVPARAQRLPVEVRPLAAVR